MQYAVAFTSIGKHAQFIRDATKSNIYASKYFDLDIAYSLSFC